MSLVLGVFAIVITIVALLSTIANRQAFRPANDTIYDLLNMSEGPGVRWVFTWQLPFLQRRVERTVLFEARDPRGNRIKAVRPFRLTARDAALRPNSVSFLSDGRARWRRA